MLPIVHGLEKQYGDRVNFIYLDIDDPATDELKKTLKYRYQPHYILLDGEGNPRKTWNGLVPENILVEAFEEILVQS